MRAVQYHPYYCKEALADLEANGTGDWARFDTSHDLSIIDDDGTRWYIGSYRGADKADAAGIEIVNSGVIPSTAKRK